MAINGSRFGLKATGNEIAASVLPWLCLGAGQAQAQQTSIGAVAGLSVAGSIVIAAAGLAVAGGVWFSTRRRAIADQAALAEYREVLARSTAVLSSAPDGYFEFSAGSGLESCSAGLAAILGVPVVGVNQFADLSDQFDRQDFAALDAAAQALRRANTPFDLRVTTGSDRLLQARGRVVTGTGAEPISFLIWFHDISGFRAETVALMDQAARAVEQQALTHRPRRRSHRGPRQRHGPTAVRHRHFRPGQAPKSHGEILETLRDSRRLPKQADFPAFKAQVLEQYTSVIEPLEEQQHLPDGRTLRVVTAPHTLGGLLFIYEDVSDRLETERSRNTLAAVQLATLDHLFEGVAVFGSDGRLQLSNSGYAKIWNLDLGYLATEPHVADLAERCRTLFPISGGDDWPTVKARVIDRTLDRTARSARLERPDGTVVDYASVPLPDGNTLYTYFDVSDSTRIERALRDRAEALNAIIGFTEILGNEYFGALNDRQTEYVTDVLASSQQLLALINDILDLATIEAGQMMLSFETIDVKDMLSTVVKLSGRRAEQRELTLVLDCPDEIGTFDADGNRIKQVLFNLVNNSMTFTPQGRIVTVSAAREGDEIALTVADSGEGIAQGDQRAVFEKFRRSLDRRKSGAGLGLSLVKSFVELHGGHVELDSVRGAGTRVTCWLPISQPAAHRVAIEGS